MPEGGQFWIPQNIPLSFVSVALYDYTVWTHFYIPLEPGGRLLNASPRKQMLSNSPQPLHIS
jgi:hypothetical protein